MFTRIITSFALAAMFVVPAAAGAQLVPAASAAEPVSMVGPTAFIQQKADQIIGIINARPTNDSERAARRDALRAAVRDFIHLPTLAERTLGPHWDTHTPEQRAEFVGLMTELVETSYLRGLNDEGVDREAATVVFVGEREARGRFTVEANVSFERESHVVEAKMLPGDNGTYIVYDVVTDDVSLEESYGESFDRIITEHGWDELIRRMRERITEMNAD